MSDASLPNSILSRRQLLRSVGAAGLLAGVRPLSPDYAHGVTRGAVALETEVVGRARVANLTIANTRLRLDGRSATATTINGTVPGPLLRFREGDEAVIRVQNELDEDTSIHWHGILLPPAMDGVPGVSFAGIAARSSFEYRFPLRQAGTYWYHSHSGLQEQRGHYGPLIIDPAEPSSYKYDREFVIVLSDWTFENPYRVLARLKKQPDAYNYQRRTLVDLFRDAREDGFGATLRDRMMWASMRMNPTDIADVTGATYSFLLNGVAPEDNWTAVFRPGERVRLRIINAAAGSFFDVRIPGVPMTVVQSNGQPVEPVETDEFRIAIAETFDVIVTLPEDRAYTIFAEAMDRSGFACGTLAPREGMRGELPTRRRRAILAMADMGMAMDHGAMDHGVMAGMAGMHGMMGMRRGAMDHDDPPAATQMDHAAMGHEESSTLRDPGTVEPEVTHTRQSHGVGNAMVPMSTKSRLHEAGVGLGEDGWRVLRYTDLRAERAWPAFKGPTREVEIHLTGNMERYMWSIDGVPFEHAAPIRFRLGERLRLTMVNDSMMNHPMHLHGMWMELENGHGDRIPRVHTVNVKPAERVSLLITADAAGRWAFHCHVLYHMEVGMFRVVEVVAEDAHAGMDHVPR